MKYETIKVQVEGSMPYAHLDIYALDDSPEFYHKSKRPLVLLLPGGGYCMTSDREAEPFAMAFLAKGYDAAILRYSVAPAVYPTALLEAAFAISYLREHAKDYGIDPEQITIEGCSAGGHLAASLAVFWQEKLISDYFGKPSEIFRPNRLILSYPVITSGEHAHRGSFEFLLGDKKDDPEMLEKLSLEKQVTKNCPPTFLWHTYTDDCVPVENSFLFASALKKENIPLEMHIFPEGCHGLGLANEITRDGNGNAVQEECAIWIDLAVRWLGGNCGGVH